MATYIKLTVDYPIEDGTMITFKAPSGSAALYKLKVYYPATVGATSNSNTIFDFAAEDGTVYASTNGVITNPNTFTTVTLDVTNKKAYVLNPAKSVVEKSLETTIGTLAPKASPTFTGTPKSTTATKGTNTTQIATTAFVQTAIGNKQDKLTFDTTPKANSTNPVTSGGLKTAIDAKQATITGGATTITSSNLTASRALVSNASGKVAVSSVTSTELGYLSGVTSKIQTQLDNISGANSLSNYLWKRWPASYVYDEYELPSGSGSTIGRSASGKYPTYRVSNNIVVNSTTGAVSLASPTSDVTVTNISGETDRLDGKYGMLITDPYNGDYTVKMGKIYRFSGATYSNNNYLRISSLWAVKSKLELTGDSVIVSNATKSTYPYPNGVKNSYYYEFLGKLQEDILNNSKRIMLGSYKGTGVKLDESSALEINFGDYTPKFFKIFAYTIAGANNAYLIGRDISIVVPIDDLYTNGPYDEAFPSLNANDITVYYSYSNNVLKLWSSGAGDFNSSDTTYHYYWLY